MRWMSPRAGSLDPHGAVGRAGDVACGDTVQIELRVEDGAITEARHRALACPHGTAAAALLCELIEGREPARRCADRAVRPGRCADPARGQSGMPRSRRRCPACGDRRGAPGRTAATGGRPDRRRNERRRGLGGGTAEGGRGRARAGRRDAAAVDRPRRAGLRASLLLALVRSGGAVGLPRAGRAARHPRPARGVPPGGGRGVRRRPPARPHAEPVCALQRHRSASTR